MCRITRNMQCANGGSRQRGRGTFHVKACKGKISNSLEVRQLCQSAMQEFKTKREHVFRRGHSFGNVS